MSKILKGVVIGAGYFAQFHCDAWSRIPRVNISAICDFDKTKISGIAKQYGISNQYSDYKEMLIKERPDFVDIITPPETHFEIATVAADLGINIICQKPLAPTYEESKKLVDYIATKDVSFVVHENFRFQPWHREIKKLIDQGEVGELFNLNFRTRMGDGWAEDAYLSRQPYFRDYKKLLIYETGVHFIDTLSYHGGDIASVYAVLKRRNPLIKGEDSGLMFLNFENGANGLWDASRFNESNHPNPRYTFGTYLIEGSKGTIRLYLDGKITIQKLGELEKEHSYIHRNVGFAGDCCFIFQTDFVEQLLNNKQFETSGENYLKTLQIQDAVYESSEKNTLISLCKKIKH